MRENEGGGEGAPDGATDAAPPQDTAITVPAVNRSGERPSRASAWVFDALVLGWMFARGLFARTAVPKAALVPVPDQTVIREKAAAMPARLRVPEKTGRAADRNVEAANHENWGTLFVLCAFGISIAGGVGFLFVYWSGGSNSQLGGALALCLGGIGLALVLWSHWLMPQKQAIEPREASSSSPAQREAAAEAFCAGAHEVRRRNLLKVMIAASTALVAAMIVSLLRSLGTPPGDSLFTTVWKPGQRLMTAAREPVSIRSLQPGSAIVVFPEDSIGSERTQTVLIRVQEQLLQLPEERADWAPMGYVAYSRVCTHAGCTVGLFEARTNLLLCPCHQSTFDVLRSARPTSGPAARPLPQLPLYADNDGNLRAGGGFTAPPGPGFSGMPV